MTPEDIKQAEAEALAPIMHQYRMGIETLIFSWLAETGHSLKDFNIQTKTVPGKNGNIIKTWIEPKVTL